MHLFTDGLKTAYFLSESTFVGKKRWRGVDEDQMDVKADEASYRRLWGC